MDYQELALKGIIFKHFVTDVETDEVQNFIRKFSLQMLPHL